MTTKRTDPRDAHYRTFFGHLRSGLPGDRTALNKWHQDLDEAVSRRQREDPDAPMNPFVASLAASIGSDAVLRMYVNEMIAQVPRKKRVVQDIPQLLSHLDHITRIAPHWEKIEKKRNFFPVSALFAEMMMDPAGEAAFRYPPFNDAIRKILKAWCCFLDGHGSAYVLNEEQHGWLSPSAAAYCRLDEFVIPDHSAPHWGWESYNAFFHRQIRPDTRPIAAPDDPKVIVSPNDGSVYRIKSGVQATDEFWIKGEPYSLRDMLAGSAYLDRFVGGHVFQSYLSGADYHRWHAPVDGVVRQAHVVDGLMFSNLVKDIKGIKSQAYYTAVNTRGLTFIEADDADIGMVCCMPVGITEISSITLTAKRGDRVKKGDQLGYFSYGGSSMAVLFGPSAIDRFTVKAPKDPSKKKQTVSIKVNAQIAAAK